MTDMISGVPNTEDAENPKAAAGLDGGDEQLINQLVSVPLTDGELTPLQIGIPAAATLLPVVKVNRRPT